MIPWPRDAVHCLIDTAMPFVETDQGTLFYAQHGAGTPPLVCIHGAGGTHQHWGLQLRALGDTTRVIALDLPGHGRSPGPWHESIAEMSAAVLAALDALGLERAVLLGHSMGGAVAQWTVLNAPGRVAGLVLVGTGARLRVPSATIDGLANDPAATVGPLVANFYGSAAAPALRAAGETAYRQVDPRVFRGGFVACNSFDVTDRLAAMSCPTLIICGEEDRMTPPKFSRLLHEQIAGSTLVLLAHTGHMVMLEQPDAVNDALRTFFKQLTATGDAD